MVCQKRRCSSKGGKTRGGVSIRMLGLEGGGFGGGPTLIRERNEYQRGR